ncbi:Gfo/Idh/MocA family oxidoreductase [Frigoriflavimonas asaccharolytica]|uniref:Putative dehydrogenase n=1 Tax=Frigoriflavimonas asaccharolytica TaxID=2735899 RepID=A0A8J8G9A4_9FLAO|nr:Gfo/Idh/MocA family oxidoreductase [Frigoriflavimonas asaccharolytica]NRS91630.1 putative dehydrogenase [Frigoriflavimonas asaccharolytica]
MKIIKTALMAYGDSRKFFHAPFLSICDGFELIGAYERSSKNIQKDFENTVSFDSLEELLSSDAELIVINTPVHTHFELSKKALEAGKHVLVEKSFTSNLAEAIELDALAKKLDLKLCVYQNRRYDSDFKTVQKNTSRKYFRRNCRRRNKI